MAGIGLMVPLLPNDHLLITPCEAWSVGNLAETLCVLRVLRGESGAGTSGYRTTDRGIHVPVTVLSSHPRRREARPAV